jgi:hypothetical protein
VEFQDIETNTRGTLIKQEAKEILEDVLRQNCASK